VYLLCAALELRDVLVFAEKHRRVGQQNIEPRLKHRTKNETVSPMRFTLGRTPLLRERIKMALSEFALFMVILTTAIGVKMRGGPYKDVSRETLTQAGWLAQGTQAVG
jgi:hypothetical protein